MQHIVPVEATHGSTADTANVAVDFGPKAD